MKIRFDLENPYSAKFCRYNVPYGDSYDDGYESGKSKGYYEAKKELGSRAYTHICFTLNKVKNRSERDIREWNSIAVFGEEDLYPPM